MIEDPWEKIQVPAQGNHFMGVRADTELQWDCYWVRDPEGHRAWAMSLKDTVLNGQEIPTLKGIDMRVDRPLTGAAGHLYLILKDGSLSDIFLRLCMDLMAAAGESENELSAANHVVTRTWRWHQLMRGASDSGLSKAEQMGLIAELTFLHDSLFTTVGPIAGLEHWLGPVDGPKDFELGHIAVEVKARRGGATPFISISSEHQLDRSAFESVYIALFQVDQGLGDDPLAFTITEHIDSMRAELQGTVPKATELLETRLAAAGYRDTDRYTESWLVGPMALYELQDSFPSITPQTLRPGVSRVTYTVDIEQIEPFLVGPGQMMNQLEVGRG